MLLNIIKSIILGIVEGITEWLPISSTGHLVLFDSFLHLDEPAKFVHMFEYVIQFGAILAIIVLFFHKLNPFSPQKNKLERSETWSMWGKVIVAIIPSIIIGFPLNDWMDEHLMNNYVVASTLIIYGIIFIVVEYYNRGRKPLYTTISALPYHTAFLIGCFQALSIVPGTSRSGATILGAIILGASRYVSAEFSFFMAIPTMVGIFILKFGKFIYDGNVMTQSQTLILLVGSIVSFLVSILVVRFLLDYLKKHDFTIFGWYRIIVGIIILLVMFLH